MSEREVEVKITSDSRQFIKSFSRAEAKVSSFGRRVTKVMNRANLSFTKFSGRIPGLTALIGSLSMAAGLKSVIDLDARLMRVKNQANLSAKEMLNLKQSLFQIASDTSQAPEDLLTGMEKFIEKTGDYKSGIKGLRDMGIAASATATSMEDAAAMAADLMTLFRIKPDQILTYYDILSAQGKAGAFTLQNMSSQFPELLPAARGFDIEGIDEMRKFGALLQLFQRGAGSPEITKTSVVSAFSDIIKNYKKIHMLTGFNIFDPEKSEKAKRKVLKDVDVIFKEIVRRTKGDPVMLQEIFGKQAQKGVKAFVLAWDEFKDFRAFDDLAKKGGNGVAIMEDFANWSDTTAAKLGDVETQAKKLLHKGAKEPVSALNKALDWANKNPNLAAGSAAGGVGIAALLAELGLAWPVVAIGGSGVGGYQFGKAIEEPIRPIINAWVKGLSRGKHKDFGDLVYDLVHKPSWEDYLRVAAAPFDLFSPSYLFQGQQQPTNNINLVVNIQNDGRVSTESDDMKTKVKTEVKRGGFFDWPF